jgi:N,N'-diacetyllegionaminate synthase
LYSRERTPDLWERVLKYEFPLEWLPDVRDVADELGVRLWASVFDAQIAHDAAGCLDAVKVASGDLMNERLIKAAAGLAEANGIPLVVSTGAGTLGEVGLVGCWALGESKPPLFVLFHCVSAYPAEPEAMNLRAFDLLEPRCDVVGLSDHTRSNLPAQLARAMGYTFFEKHFMLDDTPQDCPDAVVALRSGEFASYVRALRLADSIIGFPVKEPHASEQAERLWARRGVDGLRPTEEAVQNE